MQTPEERKQRLERLLAKHPHINRAAHLNDLELCKKYTLGEQVPFEQMFQIAHGKLTRYVNRNNCGSHLGINVNEQDREDLIADTVSVAILQLNMFHGWSLFSTWMIAIARYRIISLIKKRCKEKAWPLDDTLHSQNDCVAVCEILSCLSELDATIVQLKAVERGTFAEIAKLLNLSVENVRRRYQKSIDRLRLEVY